MTPDRISFDCSTGPSCILLKYGYDNFGGSAEQKLENAFLILNFSEYPLFERLSGDSVTGGMMEVANGKVSGRIWKFGPCEYNEIKRELWVKGKPASLRDRPLDVLVALLRNPQHTLTKDELIDTVWPGAEDGANEEGSLTTSVKMLRDAIGLADRNAVIRTLHGVGYQIAVPVQSRLVQETVEPEVRLVPGSYVPGKRDWKLVRPLDALEPHWVWLAEHQVTRQVHVFKFAEDGVRLQALQREITLSRYFERLAGDSTCFVKVFDWRLTTKPFFLEAEYGGVNLAEWAQGQREAGGLAHEACLSVMAELAEAIASAHSIGVLHNDLKPSNVLISPRNGVEGKWHVKVCDFGIGTLFEPQRLADLDITSHGFSSAENGFTSGSIMYRAPEVRPDQPATVTADVYSLGIILYQMVSGDFLGTPTPGWEVHVSDEMLRRDIADTANKDPNLRTQTAAALADRLRRLPERRAAEQTRLHDAAVQEQAAQAIAKERQRRPWIMTAAAILVVGCAVSLWSFARAARQRDLADERSRVLAGMNSFLADDLLNQSNPLRGKADTDEQRALQAAIDRALPQIDRRFAHAPEVAGRLHEVIGGIFEGRGRLAEAEREFGLAAERFGQAEGPNSEDAMIAELRREHALIRTRLPDQVSKARHALQQQKSLMAGLPFISPTLQAWEAMTESGIYLVTGETAKIIPVVNAAVQREQMSSVPDPHVLLSLKLRCVARTWL